MYEIKVQSPFTRHPDAYPDCNNEKALALYQAIDWEELYSQIEASGDSPENPFYFYEINRRNNLGENEMLCISGCLYGRVGVGYMRPKMERKGFFKKKDVLNPRFATQMDGVESPFALTCLQAFLRGDAAYLEENLINQEEGFSQ
ncbi:hypothetical protein [Chitinophaga sp. Cy-1792]|uniref:hypothetical protein n=1 Tax=Chitinophaga sp. Cy-1792 TaxID=2608339 RepID=UPI00141F1940|nr:hypothetical protein [Chitinophaga sp. Cy-1792]NIG54365.1 hypothetical protein [Chitinophaga sp. Cy-1792]